MSRSRRFARQAAVVLALAGAPIIGRARAQDGPAAGTAGDRIEQEYQRSVKEAAVRRIGDLARLAATQPEKEAAATYERVFQYAIGEGLFAETVSEAKKILAKADKWPQQLVFLADVVAIQGLAATGAHDESLELLTSALAKSEAADAPKGPAPALDAPRQAALAELYFQRLAQGERIDLARKAMTLLRDKAKSESVRELADRRLKQLELVGRPAPAISGTDLDGKSVTLDSTKGNVVLLVFWATWCEPTTDAVPTLVELERLYREKGFRIVGVNLDGLAEDTPGPAAVRSSVRRFLVEHNVSWPTLVAETGEKDPTKAYAVKDIPASYLIGRDGKVLALDLTVSNLKRSVEKALGEPRK